MRLEWKKELVKKLVKSEKIERESIPSVVKRCPQCKRLTLQYDPSTNKVVCTSCGFEAKVPQMG